MSSVAKTFAKTLVAVSAILLAGPAFASHSDELWSYINSSSHIDPNVVNRLRKKHKEPHLNLEITESPDGRLVMSKPLNAKQKKQRAEQLAKQQAPVERNFYVPRGNGDELTAAFARPYRTIEKGNASESEMMALAWTGFQTSVPRLDSEVSVALLVPSLPGASVPSSVQPSRPTVPSTGPIQTSPLGNTERVRAAATSRRTPAAARRVVAPRKLPRARAARRHVMPRTAPDVRYDRRTAQLRALPRSAPDFRRSRQIAVRTNPGKVRRTYARIKTFLRRLF